MVIQSCEMPSDEAIPKYEACELCWTSGVSGVETVRSREQYYAIGKGKKATMRWHQKDDSGAGEEACVEGRTNDEEIAMMGESKGQIGDIDDDGAKSQARWYVL